jgi:hypothetical protein
VLERLDDAALRRWCGAALATLRRHQREIDELKELLAAWRAFCDSPIPLEPANETTARPIASCVLTPP